MISDRLGAQPVAVQLPIGSEDLFQGMVDLITRKAWTFPGDLGANPVEMPIPADLADKSRGIARADDRADRRNRRGFDVKFLEGGGDQRGRVARRRCARRPSPASSCRCSAARRCAPRASSCCSTPWWTICRRRSTSPAVRGINPETEEEEDRPADPNAPAAAWCSRFRPIRSSADWPTSASTRACSQTGQMLHEHNQDRKERIGRLVQVYAEQREDVTELGAATSARSSASKQTFTGETLCDPDAPIVLETIEFPEPVISVAIEPKTKADQDKLANALQRLAEEDPTFRVRVDEQTGQTLISGMGELHLEVLVDRMQREFGVQAHVGRHQVAYRETITRKVQVETALRPPDRRPRPVRARHRGVRAAGAGQGLRVRRQGDRRVPSARSTSRPVGQGIRVSRWRTACWAVIRWSTSGRRWSAAPSMRSTAPIWRSRSRARWRSAKGRRRPGRSSSSR